MFEQLLGGDAGKAISGIVEQFESGNAAQVSPEDAAAHHDAVAQHVTTEQYQQAATETAEKMTPEQRAELGPKLATAAKAQGHDVDATLAKHGGDPTSSASIGSLLTSLKDTPGGMSTLLTEKGAEKEAETLLQNPAVRTALVGVAATAAKKFL
jgi:enamine deaminase RidA (YjgF/YER057c/UK114 family)